MNIPKIIREDPIGVGFCLLIVGSLMAGCINNCPLKYTVSESVVQMAAVHNQANVEGSMGGAIFVVGIVGGDIRTVDYYSYYYYLSDGGVMRGKVPADVTIIYEENRTDGVMHTFQPADCDCHGCDNSWFNKTTYAMHIPKGSITREFKLQ